MKPGIVVYFGDQKSLLINILLLCFGKASTKSVVEETLEEYVLLLFNVLLLLHEKLPGLLVEECHFRSIYLIVWQSNSFSTVTAAEIV